MHVEHRKQTLIAYAPDDLAAIQRRHGMNAWVNQSSTGEIPDIVHFHNCWTETNKPAVIQYHSEPVPSRVQLDCPYKKLVIAQYHATLPEYADCTVVRNAIDFERLEYALVDILDGIRIGFSPSTKRRLSSWFDKGYEKTLQILQRIKKARPAIEYDIITDVTLEECLHRKSLCNIIIDECITPSYHRSGLEGLALGKMTICSLSSDVTDVLLKASGAPNCPFLNVGINELEEYLIMLIDNLTIEDIVSQGRRNRTWMEKYWHPRDIVMEFRSVYEDLLR